MLLGAAGACVALAAPAQGCALALVLALDVSASVDAAEFRMQLQGTAAALTAPPVVSALLGQGPVAVAVTLWAGLGEQAQVVGWRLVSTPDDITALAARVAATPRPDWGGRTATGAALAHAAALFAAAPPCARQVIDVSTDDAANEGPDPQAMRLGPVTVNALAVGGDLPLDHGSRAAEGGALTRWLETRVIRGPGAFVEAADDWRDFGTAMERKLLREVMGQTVAGDFRKR
ncbi:MAG: DUF1194 domain-containing protein [Gemmobacter sp.]|nr:DUF1194 domain-containing protein [Gemmobacter sp.]